MTSTPISAALAALRLSQLSAGRQGSFTGSASGRQGSFTGSSLAAGSPLQPGSPESPRAGLPPPSDAAAAAAVPPRSLLARQDSPLPPLGPDSRSAVRCAVAARPASACQGGHCDSFGYVCLPGEGVEWWSLS